MTGKSPKRRLRVKSLYTIIEEAVERGARFGWARAHKHTTTPDDEVAVETIVGEVMLALGEAVKL